MLYIMREDLLKQFRSEYVKKSEINNKNAESLKVLLERKAILENSPLIKSYIELNEQIDTLGNNIISTESIFLDTLSEFENKGLNDKTNEMYYYLGSFDIDEDGNEFQVYRDDYFSNPLFERYIELESKRIIEIPSDDADQFENENCVVIDSDYPDVSMFSDIRKEYFYEALQEGQEIACKKFLSINKH